MVVHGHARRVIHRTAEAVRDAVTELLTPFVDFVHTTTYDNGREFADHEGMASDLRTPYEVFFNTKTSLTVALGSGIQVLYHPNLFSRNDNRNEHLHYDHLIPLRYVHYRQ